MAAGDVVSHDIAACRSHDQPKPDVVSERVPLERVAGSAVNIDPGLKACDHTVSDGYTPTEEHAHADIRRRPGYGMTVAVEHDGVFVDSYASNVVFRQNGV